MLRCKGKSQKFVTLDTPREKSWVVLFLLLQVHFTHMGNVLQHDGLTTLQDHRFSDRLARRYYRKEEGTTACHFFRRAQSASLSLLYCCPSSCPSIKKAS